MQIKLHIITILYFLLTGFSYSQEKSEIDSLISNLSWKSITCDHMYHSFIVNYQDSSVIQLIKIGEPAIDNLYNAIDNPQKTVITHMILTNIMEPEK